MTSKNIVWFNGPAAEEHEFLEHLQSATSLETIQIMARARQDKLKGRNEFDYSRCIATCLGVGFGIGLGLFLFTSSLWDLGLYLMALCYFHSWEYFYVAVFHPTELDADSFLLNHSKEYSIAMGASFVEYFLEWLLFPWLKTNWFFGFVGAVMVIAGLAIRSMAMWKAGSNFHHQVRETKETNHKLVADGIYSVLRHPSYFGWFWFSVGTQIMIMNPLIFGPWVYFAWQFFADRIPFEEKNLIKIFGKDYEEYRQRVPVGIPMIS